MLQVEPELIDRYVADGRLSLAFHHVLDHGDASSMTHRAVECAGVQDPLAFWDVHTLFFERQGEFWRTDEAQVIEIAAEIGLDKEALATCMADPAVQAKVTRMDQARRDAGIRLRPSFDLNGEILQGSVPFSAFQETIDALLN